jgi:protein involved in polysaccharide export with SLBB domain
LIALLSFALNAGVAQFQSQSSKKGEDIETLLQEKMQSNISQPSGIALESTVNPEFYYVGPSDIIAVSIWMSPPLNFSLTVTPEGTLIIPTVGEVAVANMTLAQAKAYVMKEVRRKYITPEITVTLIKPRPIVVSITGTVLNPGLYTLNAVDRANKLIEEANKLSKLQSPEDLIPLKKMMSTRNIVIKRKDGSELRVDLLKYFAAQQDTFNPYLREGDVVVVPRKDPFKNVFGVYGQVNSPGRYEFVEGDNVLDAIGIAHGTTRLAMTDKAIFSRLSPDGTTLSTQTINLSAIMTGTEKNMLLEPGDRIVVQGKHDLREDYNVDVKGEVLFPATYPITKDRTRLSEIIRQAGGFTEDASLSSATIIRKTYEQEDVPDEAMISQRGVVSTEDTLGYALENSLRLTREAVTVDFVKLFAEGDSTQDIILHAEDEVVIPKLQHTIYVFGQVASPGHIAFTDEKNTDYYIHKAGGFSDRASSGDVKIVKSKTKQWLSPGDTKLEPGDYIWVPAEPDHPFSYYMTIASQAASVLSIVIGVAVLVVQVSK